ncbi:MAG TPA: tetratricopeptide repeat protein [bacterium]|nr:tetratricopeptide repeat protein [bacterium]
MNFKKNIIGKAIVLLILIAAQALILDIKVGGCAEINKIKAKEFYEQSLILYKQNKISEAIDSMKQAIQYDFMNNMYYYNIGTYYLKLKDYDSAIDSFMNSVKFNSNHQESYYNLGLSYIYKNDFVKAADYFSQAVAYNQFDIDAHINLGLAYKNLKQYDAAMIEYQKALMINPDNTAASVNLAVLYKIQGNTEKSIELLNEILAKDPKNTEALYNLGLLKEFLDKKKGGDKTGDETKTEAPVKTADSEKIVRVKHMSSITGKEVTPPISYAFPEDKTRKNEERLQPAEKIQSGYGIENYGRQEYLNFKTELITEIRKEFKSFIQELKQITQKDNSGVFNSYQQYDSPNQQPFQFDLGFSASNTFGLNSSFDYGTIDYGTFDFTDVLTGPASQSFNGNYIFSEESLNIPQTDFGFQSFNGTAEPGIIDFSNVLSSPDFGFNQSSEPQIAPDFETGFQFSDNKTFAGEFDFAINSFNQPNAFAPESNSKAGDELFPELFDVNSEILKLDDINILREDSGKADFNFEDFKF